MNSARGLERLRPSPAPVFRRGPHSWCSEVRRYDQLLYRCGDAGHNPWGGQRDKHPAGDAKLRELGHMEAYDDDVVY